ncbi:pilus assembly protein PilM [Candidatus Omnitrophota bacterium]
MKAIIKQLQKETKSLLSGLGLKTKAENLIGLDLGLKYFKAARIQKTSKGLSIKNSLIKEAEYVKDLNKDMSIDSEEAIFVNFSGDNMAVRRTSVPVMPHEEIEGALKWELKDQVKFDIDKTKIRFNVLGEIDSDDGSRKIDLIAVVYKDEDVEEKVKRLKDLGLNIQGVFPSEFAIASYVTHLGIVSPRERVAIADIGSVKTTIGIIENGKLSFARDVAVGGDNITEAMTGVLMTDKGKVELSKDRAEKIKREQGISEDIRILSMMRPVLERFSNEIKRSLEYYAHRFKCDAVKNIILTGGGSNLKGLKEYLSKETGLQVLEALPETACAAGLPLLNESDLNMIPARFKDEKKTEFKRFSLRMFFVVLLSLFFIFYGLLFMKVANLKNELDIYRPHWATLKDVRSIKDKITMLGYAVNVVSHENIYTGRVMRELSNLTSSFVIFSDLIIKDTEPNVKIAGVVLKEESLSEFMSNLETSPVFEKVKLSFSEKNEDYSKEALDFEIVCSVVR